MAFNSADWTIDYVNKTVTNNDSGTGDNLPQATGDYSKIGNIIDFFQWLATTFAATAQMDDEYPIQSDTPTVYKWLNGWTFGHADDFKYLRGGSIEDPAGSGTSTADSLWANLYSIGTQTKGTQLYLMQNDTVQASPWWISSDGTESGNIDILILVKDTGTWIQSDNTAGTPTNGGIWIYAREFGDLYDHNFADLSGGGRNPIGINTSPDSGNKSGEIKVTVADGSTFTPGEFAQDTTTGGVGKIAKVDGNDVYLNAVRGGTITVSNNLQEFSERECVTSTNTAQSISAVTDVVKGYTDITGFGTFSGPYNHDMNNGNGAVNYDVEVDCAGRTMAQVYEWLKYVTRYGSSGATYTINADDGQEYRSCDEGTYADVKVAPYGTLAGTTFYGARGVWVENYAAADFVLIDSTGAEQAPPNYQKVICSHANLSGCNIFVAEYETGAVKKDQYTYDDGNSTSTELHVLEDIDANKTPQSGIVRIGDNQYPYTSFSGKVFTVTVDPTGETDGADAYVPLLDITADATSEQSDNIIYTGDINVITSVRKYGFKPYDVVTTFGSTGLSFSPILNTDPQAS